MKPELGQWYVSNNAAERFCVIAVDAEEELIEVQYEDGDVEELDFDDWSLFVDADDLRPVDAPFPTAL